MCMCRLFGCGRMGELGGACMRMCRLCGCGCVHMDGGVRWRGWGCAYTCLHVWGWERVSAGVEVRARVICACMLVTCMWV